MFVNRVRHTTTTTGTGTYDLIDVTGPWRSAVSAAGSGNTISYLVTLDGNNDWEICTGVVTAGSPATLTRVLVASSTGALINWPAGTKSISSVADADLMRFGAAGAIPTATGTANAITVSYNPPLRARRAGMYGSFLASAANTGAVTLNIDGTGALALNRGDGTVAMIGGEIAGASALVNWTFDGTRYRMTNVAAAPAWSVTSGELGFGDPIGTNLNSGYTLPAGGTWRWWAFQVNNAGQVVLNSTVRGRSAGGTTVLAATANIAWFGLAERIA